MGGSKSMLGAINGRAKKYSKNELKCCRRYSELHSRRKSSYNCVKIAKVRETQCCDENILLYL